MPKKYKDVRRALLDAGWYVVRHTGSEVGERIEESLAAYADDLRKRGGSLPAPHRTTGTIAA